VLSGGGMNGVPTVEAKRSVIARGYALTDAELASATAIAAAS
jgi:hypothetical protein